MSKAALWAGAGGALALVTLDLRKERAMFELSGLKQLELITRSGPADYALGVIFGKPLPHAVVSGGWGDKRPKRVGSFHYAVDLRAKTGTPIYAATSGVVVWADARGDTTAGKYVVVKHGGVHTRYLHMSAVRVERGQRVELGQVLGFVGLTGLSSAPHLHLDVFLSDDLLAVFRDQYGTPRPSFPRKRRWGTQVPAETLIPVDGYSTKAIEAALWRDVRLRSIEVLTNEVST